MSHDQRRTDRDDTLRRDEPHKRTDQAEMQRRTQAETHRGQEEHSRESGRWGAEEPDYGRPPSQRPNPEPRSGPNRKGPQYEEGGRYPGTRETNEHTPLRSRSADPGQSSYGGFKNEDPRYQRQQHSSKKS